MAGSYKGILCLLAFALSFINGYFALDSCPDQRWFLIEGDCFLFVVTPTATFQDAQITCNQQAEFAVLAKINPVDPQYIQFLERRPLTGIFAPQFLIGLSDSVTEGEFRWLDGTWPTEVNWADGHPVRISREVEDRLDCVIVNDVGQWESVQCIQSYSFVCAVLDGTVPNTEFNECTAPGASEQLCLGPNDFCEDALAGYHCVCETGYQKNDNNECQDINECLTDPCMVNEACTNSPGGYRCECLPGHSPVPGAGCIDINECDNATICMGYQEVCSNFAGGFSCTCNEGFVKDDRNICVDIDECADPLTSQCVGERNEICMNTLGGHVCLCQRYFSRDQNGVCIPDSTCCPSGFELFGGNCHIIINELRSYTDASDFCNSIGGFLSKIDPLDAVTQFILDNWPEDVDGVWIGLNDIDFEGVFTWVADGTVVGGRVNRWGPQQPQSILPSLDCVFMTVPPLGTWHTTQCTQTIQYAFVCQRPTITECPPVNPCEIAGTCSGQFEVCSYSFGQHTCSCLEGFRRNTVTELCEDIDECEDGSVCTGGFQTCNNLLGSHECLCREGTTLRDGFCQDVNECEGNNPCTGNRECTNTLGSYRCNCAPGFEPIGLDCIDINECAYPVPVCSGDGEECTNLEGSYRCDNVTCQLGYRREGRQCFDIDECLQNPCIRENEYCLNTEGSHECLCVDGTGRDINNNCVGVCCPQGTTALGNYCYQIRNSASDVVDFVSALTVCQTAIPDSIGSLVKLDETFQLVRSLAELGHNGEFWIGFEKDSQDNLRYRWLWDRTFVSLDPIFWRQGGPVQISGLENCGSVNLDSFLMDNLYCGLRRPFICQHRQISCDSSNECEFMNPCVDVPNTQCVYEGGQVLCVCQPGFQYDTVLRRCLDVECSLMDPESCSDPNEVCRFSPTHARGYYCDCEDGYQRGPDGTCVDRDECTFTTCPGLNRQCFNTEGSYTCDCRPGFLSAFDGECIPETEFVNECEESPCVGSNVHCEDQLDGFICVCDPGYVLFTILQCRDIDECDAIPVPCPLNSMCENTPGSFNCNCLEGYQRIGDECRDVNECLMSPCTNVSNTECINLSGSFTCVCLTGFFLDPNGVCEDQDECFEMPNVCPGENRECLNTIGSYRCVCTDGYDNVNNECVPNMDTVCIPANNPCSDAENEVCVNMLGVATCVCKQGFFLRDGVCIAESACNADPNLCTSTQLCVDTAPAEFRCDCRVGFVRDLMDNCVAERICTSDTTLCTESPNQVCVSLDFGAYECVCRESFERLDGECTAVDVCVSSPSSLCGLNEVCEALGIGEFQCVCQQGFVRVTENSCEAEDVCDRGNFCDINEECTDVNGTPFCTCIDGYSRQGGICQPDQNPCNSPDICSSDRVCTLRESGSIICVCPEGTVEVSGVCQNQDGTSPCDDPNACTTNESCREVAGAPVCDCMDGFSRVGGVCQVAAVNPCDELACGLNEVCVVTSDVAACECQNGYTRISGICQQPAGCLIPGICGENSECVPLAGGSITCSCIAGFTRQDNVCVEDEDPCTSPDVCGTNQVCVNNGGQPQCDCAAGFSLQGGECQPIIDPCLNPDSCETNEVCINNNGQPICNCADGFVRQADNTCQIPAPDPCVSYVCGTNEECSNIDGHPGCRCSNGFNRLNGVCVISTLTQCASLLDICPSPTDECHDVNGLSLCSCVGGFQRAGLACVPEGGECTIGNNDCLGDNVECAFAFGSTVPVCQCITGFAENSAGVCVATTPDITCNIGASDCGINEICIIQLPNNVCICQESYERNSENACVFIGSICGSNPNICQTNANCFDDSTVDVGYRCECVEGYFLNANGICEVEIVDVCLAMPELCPGQFEVCETGSLNTHSCNCIQGYWRVTAGAECTAINPCLMNPCNEASEECQIDTGAVNGYNCVCRAGFERLTPTSPCTAPNPCLANPCTGSFESCQVAGSGFTCFCQDGYVRFTAGGDCTMDVCNPTPCTGSFESCVANSAVADGYACNCIDGYARPRPDDQCAVLSACNPDPCMGPSEMCMLAPDIAGQGFQCTCIDGYTRETVEAPCTMVLSGVCDTTPCTGDNEVCREVPNGHVCNCQEGYARNFMTDACEVNPCAVMDICPGQNEFCLSRDQAFSCECMPGFMRTNDGLYCVSVNIDQICSSNSALCDGASLVCQDGTAPGEYRCECQQGFVRESGSGNCIETNFQEVSTCAMNPQFCNGFREQCVDGQIQGSYVCECEAGYEYVDDVCTEQAPCVDSPCSSDSEVCVDLPEGRFRCDCAAGYTRRDGECVVVELTKCNLLINLCEGVDEVCIDTPDGEHICECAPGYQRFENGECKATCAAGVVVLCGENADCVDTPLEVVKYRCDCHFGHIKHDGRCFVSPRCNSNPNPCQGEFELCVDIEETGTYRCDCQEFYHRVEGVCTVKMDCCPNDGTFVDGICYKFVNDEVPFDDAQQNCSLTATDGHLAKVVPSIDLRNFISDGIQQLDVFFAWIGLTSSPEWDVDDGLYTWLSDRTTVPLNHPSWRGNIPSEPCVALNFNLDWTSIRCDLPNGFLCEYGAIQCVDPPPPQLSDQCVSSPCDISQNLVCVDTPQWFVCICKEDTQEINGRCLYTESIESEIRIVSINGEDATYNRQLSDPSTTESTQLTGLLCDVLLNALTRSSSPTEFDCEVSRYESGSIIAQYRVRVGEETEDEAEDSIKTFEDVLMEIVTEEEQEHFTGDGMDSIVIAKVIRDDCDRIQCENGGNCLVRADNQLGYCECPSEYTGDFCENENAVLFLFGLFDVYWFGWLLFAIPVLAILLVSVICFCCVSRKNKQGNRNSNLQTVVTLPSLKREASNPQSQPLVNDMESAASTPEEQRKRKKLENDLRSSQLFNRQQETSGDIPLRKQPPPVAPKPIDRPTESTQGPSGVSRQTPVVNTQGPSGIRSGRSPQRNQSTKGRKPSPSQQKNQSKDPAAPTKQGQRNRSASPQKARPKGPETGSLKRDQRKGPETGSLQRNPKKVPEKGSLDRNQNRASQRSNTSRSPPGPGGRPQGGPPASRPQRTPSRASQSSVNSRNNHQGPSQAQQRGRPPSKAPPESRNGSNPPEGRKRSPAVGRSRSPNNRVRRKINGGKVPKPHKGPETAPTIYI